jgi:type IV pilus assembly protein PilW
MRRCQVPSRAAQAGLTLIELMVGLTLGMIVSLALLQLFAQSSVDGQNVQRASIDIENGRYAAEMLRDDLQLAGYLGEVPIESAGFVVPDPCSTDAATAGFAASPLAVPTAVRGYGAAEVLGCLAARDRLAGTDALAVRRVEVATADPAALGAGNTAFHLQTSFCIDDPAATPIVFSRTPADFTLRDRACAGANEARAYVSRLYFVAACNVCGSDDLPTLKRLDLVGNQLVETPLVEGVESLRIEYGFDLDGNGSADEYRTTAAVAGPASQWQNVMSLKLHYIVRSTTRASGALAGAQTFELGGAGTVETPDDGFVRRAYSQTVRLINPSGAREVP